MRIGLRKMELLPVFLLLGMFLLVNSCGNNSGGGVNVPTPTPAVNPTVLSVSPSNESTNVARNASVQVVFSKDMDSSTIDNTTITVKTATGVLKEGQIEYDPSLRTACFTPASAYALETTYWVTASNGIKDTQGNPLLEDHVTSFMTGSYVDTSAPAVTATYPLQNSTGVSCEATFYITFDEDINYSSVSFEACKGAGGMLEGVLTADASTQRKLYFTPSATLEFHTTYEVKVAATDLMGNRMAAVFTLKFRAKGWGMEKISSSGRDPALAMDSSANLYLVYTNIGIIGNSISCRQKPPSGDWADNSFSIIGSSSQWVNLEGDVAVEQNGVFHAAYYYGVPTMSLFYAYEDQPDDYYIRASQYAAAYCDVSIAIDSQSRPYIAYYKHLAYENGQLAIATPESAASIRTLSSLQTAADVISNGSTVVNTGLFINGNLDGSEGSDVGRSVDILIDSNDWAHICYVDVKNQQLKSAQGKIGQPWGLSTLVQSDVGTYCAMAKDSSDNLYIVFNSTSGELKLLKLASPYGASEATVYTLAEGEGGAANSIYIDSEGGAHIAYYNYNDGWLKYAHRDSCSGDLSVGWNTYNIKHANVVHTAIAADPGVKKGPWIVYETSGPNIEYVYMEE